MSENNHVPAPHQVSIEVGGRRLTLEMGKIAKQANGAVTARYGDTGESPVRNNLPFFF